MVVFCFLSGRLLALHVSRLRDDQVDRWDHAQLGMGSAATHPLAGQSKTYLSYPWLVSLTLEIEIYTTCQSNFRTEIA